MNKIKPQVGQVWRDTRTNGEAVNVTRVFEIDGDLIVDIEINRQFIERDSYYIDCFTKLFEFVPQNDLEWLAVNVGGWNDCYSCVRRRGGGIVFCCNSKISETYTRQQWQSMRYKLGLDEKPRISAKEWARILKNNSK